MGGGEAKGREGLKDRKRETYMYMRAFNMNSQPSFREHNDPLCTSDSVIQY